ncbi:aminotransferase class III-fold pyridoxal phosphate-dependent enzyme [Micromonospora sp. NPDC049497]|uniref:aminotransferase class III-fold pyridoxal phosphate-dependent enzyme n=1 Tax=Micromonospora sp. NPDC049497 TaxID=3364273 RepID=UPI0037B3117B
MTTKSHLNARDAPDLDDVAVVRRHLLGAPGPEAPVIRRQVGARIEAADGSSWLDAASAGFGPGHPTVTERLVAQAGRTALSSRILVSRPLAEAVTALHRLCPDPLTVSYLCNSGAEALDSALKLAKGTHPRRRLVVGFAGADHGTLLHGLSLTHGFAVLPDQPLRPVAVPRDRPDELVARVRDDVAAVVVAPAAPGRRLADLTAGWWRRLRAACDRSGALLVLDERLTGPARLGVGLAADRLPAAPDALVLGETLGADAVPVGCVVTGRDTYDRVYARRNPSLHGSTFGASPLSAAAVAAVLAVCDDERLADGQRAVENLARSRLAPLVGTGAVTDMGADGALVWLRLATPAAARALAAELTRERVLVRPPDGDVVAVLPPLTAAPEDVTELLDRVTTAGGRFATTWPDAGQEVRA